jgi:hypothetical protein
LNSNCETNRIRKFILSVQRFEPESLGRTTDSLDNSAMPLLPIVEIVVSTIKTVTIVVVKKAHIINNFFLIF